jgi:hypothetical protein
MGPYLCIASNGIPPSVSKRIMLIVHCKRFEAAAAATPAHPFFYSSSNDLDPESASRRLRRTTDNTRMPLGGLSEVY